MTAGLVELTAPGVHAVVAPELGGRILSLRLNGREVLWRNPRLTDADLRPRVEIDRVPLGAGFGAWQNWGGDKTWPAPQGWSGPGAWPGPPDGVLDAGGYDVLDLTGASVRLRSGVEPRTGLRIERELQAEPGALTVHSILRNDGAAAARWAAWEVAQFLFDDGDIASDAARIDVGLSRAGEPLVLFQPVGRMAWHPDSAGVRVPFQRVVGKLGFPAATGRAELVRADGSGVVMTFGVDAAGEYADDSPFQLWMQTPFEGALPGLEGLDARDAYVELEALSPLVPLRPGEQVDLTVRLEDRAADDPA